MKHLLLILILLPFVAWGQVLTVPNGGTGTGNFSPHGPVIGQGKGPMTSVNPGQAGQCLISGGPTVDPVFAACPSGSGGGSSGGGGFGFIVPSAVYPTVQQALSAAQSAGSGPVVVLPNSTDTSSYVNPSNIRIDTYKQDAAGQDSRFFRDVSEWGRIDGKTMTCNAVAGSNSLTCSGVTFVNTPVSQGGDIGKLILVDGAGPQTGQVGGTISVASTSGVTPGGPGDAGTWQGVIFNDPTDGCNTIDTMPYAFVSMDNTGMPVGNLHWTQNFYGKGCVHPPTSGTVNTTTGTVTFSGGTMVNGDLVSVITAVTGTNTITIADSALVTLGSTSAVYGTDVHDTFQAACNSLGKGGGQMTGTLTFSGIGLTSHGIDCNSSGIKIIGNGYGTLNPNGAGSTLVYAGKTPNTPGANATSYVLNMAYGWGAVLERVGIRGNTQGQPYGIMLSFGTNCPGTGCLTAPGSGNGINQYGKIDQAWIGWEWGDGYAGNDPIQPIRLQSCVFSNGVQGNSDFWQFDRIYCMGADVGLDYVNDQATNYHIGKWYSQFDNIGLALAGYIDIDDYSTEFNRVDYTMGSPYWPGAPPVFAHFKSYGGESSAMETENPAPGGQNWNSFGLQVDNGGLGGGNDWEHGGSAYNRPDNTTSTYSSINNGSISYHGMIRGKVVLPWIADGATGSYGGLNWNFSPLFTNQIIWTGSGPDAGSYGWAGGGWLTIDNPLGGYNTHIRVPLNASDWYPSGSYPLMLDVNRSQTHIGSLNVQSPSWGKGPSVGYGDSLYTIGTAGTTTYNYQITCVDSLGGETLPAPVYGSSGSNTIFTLTTGNATLNTTNYNQFSIQPREGCPRYNLYGDGGIGGTIGFLATLTIEQMPGGRYINDQGAWTKNTSIRPPTTNQSGSLNVGGNLTVGGLTQLNNVNISGTCSGTGCGTGGGGSMVYPTAGIPNSTGTAWGPSYTSTPGSQIPSNFIPTLNQSTTGNAATASSLDHSPPQCSAGNFAIGITATGSANCATPPGGTGGNAQVVIATGTTPLTIKSQDLGTSITFTMANGTTPSITSSTGAINFSDLIISDLAGTGTALLQADSSGNVSRSTASAGIPYPPAPAGIPATDGTQWLANYNASNPIPSSYIPILNQPTTANAGTATALAGTPTLCPAGQFPSGILPSGNATGCAAPTSSSTPINGLSNATNNGALTNGGFQQTWNWVLGGTSFNAGLKISETSASSNSNPSSALLLATTVGGSTVGPFSAMAHANAAGLLVTAAGDIQAQGTATFIGPHRLPGVISAASLATDSAGNITVGSGGAGMTWPTSTGIAVYNGSSAWTTSFSSTNPIPFNYLSTSVPLVGSCTTGQYQTASSNTGPTCSQVNYSQLTGTIPNAPTATALSTSGTANQVWAMNSTGTTQGWRAASASSPVPLSLVAAVSQGSGNSFSGSCAATSCPTAIQLAAGSSTVPQSAAVAYLLTGIGTSPVQYINQKFTLPPTLTGTYSMVTQISFDTITSGTINLSFQYVCVAPGGAGNPTLSSVQNFAVTVPSTAGTLATVTGTPTVTGCSANNVMFTRVGITGTATTGNADIWQSTLWVQ